MEQKYTANIFISQDVLDEIYRRKHPSDDDLNATLARIIGIKQLPCGILRDLGISSRPFFALRDLGLIDVDRIIVAFLRNNARNDSLPGIGDKSKLEILQALRNKFPEKMTEDIIEILASLERKAAAK